MTPNKIWIAKDKVILENLPPFHTFGILLLAGGVEGQASSEVRKEEGTTPGGAEFPAQG